MKPILLTLTFMACGVEDSAPNGSPDPNRAMIATPGAPSCASRTVAAGVELELDMSRLSTDANGSPMSPIGTGFHDVLIQIVQTDLSPEAGTDACADFAEEDVVAVGVPTTEGVIDARWLVDGQTTYVSIQPLNDLNHYLGVVLVPDVQTPPTSLPVEADMWVTP